MSGLGTELKSKMVGHEGNLDQLLLKARFEEAKRKGLACQRSVPLVKRLLPGGTKVSQSWHPSVQPGTTKISGAGMERAGNRPAQGGANKFQKRKCFNCGMEGHVVRECPYPKQLRGPTEARGSITKLTPVETCNQDSAQRVQWL